MDVARHKKTSLFVGCSFCSMSGTPVQKLAVVDSVHASMGVTNQWDALQVTVAVLGIHGICSFICEVSLRLDQGFPKGPHCSKTDSAALSPKQQADQNFTCSSHLVASVDPWEPVVKCRGRLWRCPSCGVDHQCQSCIQKGHGMMCEMPVA